MTQERQRLPVRFPDSRFWMFQQPATRVTTPVKKAPARSRTFEEIDDELAERERQKQAALQQAVYLQSLVQPATRVQSYQRPVTEPSQPSAFQQIQQKQEGLKQFSPPEMLTGRQKLEGLGTVASFGGKFGAAYASMPLRQATRLEPLAAIEEYEKQKSSLPVIKTSVPKPGGGYWQINSGDLLEVVADPTNVIGGGAARLTFKAAVKAITKKMATGKLLTAAEQELLEAGLREGAVAVKPRGVVGRALAGEAGEMKVPFGETPKELASTPETAPFETALSKRQAELANAPPQPELTLAEARKLAKMTDEEVAAYNAKIAKPPVAEVPPVEPPKPPANWLTAQEPTVRPPIGEVPPVGPPKPPTPIGSFNSPDELAEALAKPETKQFATLTRALQGEERAKRFDRYGAIIRDLTQKGTPVDQAEAIAVSQLKGELPRVTTTLTAFQKWRPELVARIYEKLAGNEMEFKATVTALDRALEGRGIPNVLGTAEGSAYKRLTDVFGKKVVDAIANPKPLAELSPQGQIDGILNEYLRGLPTKPMGQGEVWALPAGERQLALGMSPFDPEVLKLSSAEVMQRLGFEVSKDLRTPAEKMFALKQLQLDIEMALGKIGKDQHRLESLIAHEQIFGKTPTQPATFPTQQGLASQMRLGPDELQFQEQYGRGSPSDLQPGPVSTQAEKDALRIDLARPPSPVTPNSYPIEKQGFGTNIPPERLVPDNPELQLREQSAPRDLPPSGRQPGPASTQAELDVLRIDLARAPSPVTPIDIPLKDKARTLAMLPIPTRIKLANALKRVGKNLLDLGNLPRAVQTAWDLSAPMRQGLILGTRHPVEWAKAWKPMIKVLRSEKVAMQLDAALYADPDVAEWVARWGLRRRPLELTAKLAQREEAFMSDIARKIPGVRMSERTFVTFLNQLTGGIAKTSAKTMRKMPGMGPNDYKSMAQLINWASGWGPAPGGNVVPVLNTLLYSTRLQTSRLALPTKLFSSSVAVRKEAASMLATYLGFGTTVVSLAVLGGAKTSLDPRHPDYGKIRIGNTAIDVWGGYIQWARLVARVATGQKTTMAGNVRPQAWTDTTLQFLQSKASPLAGLMVDLFKGETYSGDEMSTDPTAIGKQVYSRLTPLAVQDIIDAMVADGVVKGLPAALSVVGVGVVTYNDPITKQRDQIAQQKYGMSWEAVGKQYGRAEQMRLEQANPALKQAVTTEQNTYAASNKGQADVNVKWQTQARTLESEYLKAMQQASSEYDATHDGATFRAKVNTADSNRRSGYNLLNVTYPTVATEMDMPLTPQEIARMSPKDVARNEYNRMMYSDDMYDKYGNYQFDLADVKRQQFVQKYGQAALDYTEEYMGVKTAELPEAYQWLKEARIILKPYWEVADTVWAALPPGTAELATEIDRLRSSGNPVDKRKGLEMLRGRHDIMRAQLVIEREHAKMRRTDKKIALAYDMFYRQ